MPALKPPQQRSFSFLVKHLRAAGSTAAAIGIKAASFAQKLWRFCSNEAVELPVLIEPLIQFVRDCGGQASGGSGVLLAVQDWSTLSYRAHKSKADVEVLTHDKDVGYDLHTVLMVDGRSGDPLAPVSVSLTNADGVVSTRPELHGKPAPHHIEQVLPSMEFVRSQDFRAQVVHVIDREVDSVRHFRDWAAAGFLYLVRADDRTVLHEGREKKLRRIADELGAAGKMRSAGDVLFHGRKAHQFVVEAEVTLHKPAKQRVEGKQVSVPGDPITLRFVATTVCDDQGVVVAEWMLLTNAPAELADAAQAARWYYWRWRIESMHKTLKSAGYELEDWLQRNAERLMRKLLIALTSLSKVWDLERRRDEESEKFKRYLMRLSGRQTKHRKPVTTTGLLAGLRVLQAIAEHAKHEAPDTPDALLATHMPEFATPPPPKKKM